MRALCFLSDLRKSNEVAKNINASWNHGGTHTSHLPEQQEIPLWPNTVCVPQDSTTPNWLFVEVLSRTIVILINAAYSINWKVFYWHTAAPFILSINTISCNISLTKTRVPITRNCVSMWQLPTCFWQFYRKKTSKTFLFKWVPLPPTPPNASANSSRRDVPIR